jgi:hypothetical protein
MKKVSLILILILTSVFTHGQNLIGYTSREIQKYMKENHEEMNLEQTINISFNYLKYSDNFETQTIIFFLNSDTICRGERMICDKSIKKDKIKEFNSIYKPNGDNKWIDSRDGKDYLIGVLDEKWSFVVTIEPNK